jgi:hypothetical protein
MVALYIGWLGLYLVVTEILPWFLQHAQESWTWISSLL